MVPRAFRWTTPLLVLGVVACTEATAVEEPDPLSVGLVAHLIFQGDATDQSGNGNDGDLLGAATASGELLLGNNANDMLRLPSGAMDGLGDFTFAAWLRIDTFRDNSHEVISAANAIEDNALIFWYREGTDQWAVGVNNVSADFPTDPSIETGQWLHVALLRSGTSASLFLNGVRLGAPVTVPGDVLDIAPGGLVFGQDQDTVGGGFEADESWAGAMDNLRIYNRALTATDVAALAQESR